MIKGDIGGEGSENRVRSPEERTIGYVTPSSERRESGQLETVTSPPPPLIRVGDFAVAEGCKELLASGKRVRVPELHRPLVGGQGNPVIYHEWDDGTLREKSSACVMVRLPENVRIETAISEGTVTSENSSLIRMRLRRALRRGDKPATEQAHSIRTDTLHTILGFQTVRSKYNDMLIDPETRRNLARKALSENPEKAEVSELMALIIKAQDYDPELVRPVPDLDVEAKSLKDEDLMRVLREKPENAEVINKLEELKRRVQGDAELARIVRDLNAGTFPPSFQDQAKALYEQEEELPYSEERFNMDKIQLILDKERRPVGIKFWYDPFSSYFQQQALAGDEKYFSYKTGALVAIETSDEKLVIGRRSRNMDKGGVWSVVAEALSRQDGQDPEQVESPPAEALSRQDEQDPEQIRQELIREAREELEQAKKSPPDPYKNALRGLKEEVGVLPVHIVDGKKGVHVNLVLANHDNGTDLACHAKLNITYDEVRELWSNAHDKEETTHFSSIDFTTPEEFATGMIPDDGPRSWLHGTQELLLDVAYRRFGEDEVKDAMLDRQWQVSGITTPEGFARYMIPDDGPRNWSQEARERLYKKADREFGKSAVQTAMFARQLGRGI